MQVVVCKPLGANNIERVEKDRYSQGVNTLKDREKRTVGQLFSPNIRAEIDAAAAELRDGPFRFSDGRRGVLQGEGCQAHETVGMRPGGFRQRVVDDPGESHTESTIRPIDHRRIERESMNCCALRVHRFQPYIEIVVVRGDGADYCLTYDDHRSIRTGAQAHAAGFSFCLDEPEVFFRDKVRVNVDGGNRMW